MSEMSDRQLHQGDDGLMYDEDEFFVYTGPSPLSEDEDKADDQGE